MIVPTLIGINQPYIVQRSEAHTGFQYNYDFQSSTKVEIMLQAALDQKTFRCQLAISVGQTMSGLLITTLL